MKYIILFLNIFFVNANAIEPNEILENKKLENIAREIGKELRCLVCQNEDIQNSNADIASDLRKLVRKKLLNGDSRDDIIKYIHSRYGDYVLYSPPLRFDTLALWILPIFFFCVITFFFFRRE